MKSYEINYVSEAVRDVISKYPLGYIFTLQQFVNDVKRKYPKLKHKIFTSFDRRLRDVKVGGNRVAVCKDRSKSIYQIKIKIKIRKAA